MDISPFDQLLQHADHLKTVHDQVTHAARQEAEEAEATRPPKPPLRPAEGGHGNT